VRKDELTAAVSKITTNIETSKILDALGGVFERQSNEQPTDKGHSGAPSIFGVCNARVWEHRAESFRATWVVRPHRP
jgi:hypothetical protein